MGLARILGDSPASVPGRKVVQQRGPSVLGLMQVTTTAYDRQWDLFAGCESGSVRGAAHAP